MDIEQVQLFCLSLPSVTEDIKWVNDLVFSVGKKMFCIAALEPPFKVSFKAKADEFEELSRQNEFAPAAYLARAKWVTVTPEAMLSKKEWEHYVKGSYNLVKDKLTKREKKELRL